MKIKKRDGTLEDFDIKKVKDMLSWACEGLDVNPLELEMGLTVNMQDGVATKDIHQNSIQIANSLLSIDEPDWRYVAGRLKMTGYVKDTTIERGFGYGSTQQFIEYQVERGVYDPSLLMFGDDVFELCDHLIDPEYDMLYDMSGAVAAIDRYCLSHELPQEMLLAMALILAREASTMYGTDFTQILTEAYSAFAKLELSPSTPLLLNLRRYRPNLSSCYIIQPSDNMDSIYDNIKNVAMISKNAGGVGVNLDKIRAAGSWIKKTKGASSGVVPMIKVLNDTAVYVNQLGKRSGAVTPALSAWHLDILEFLEIQLEEGDQRTKSFDIMPQVVYNDEFMRRLGNNDEWTMFDPFEVKEKFGYDLADLTGEAFSKAYIDLENKAKLGELELVNKVRARDLFKAHYKAMRISGMPYITFKDTINENNPNKASGVIYSANLCVTGDAKILTKQGYVAIESIAGTEQELWNGEEWTKSEVFKTSDGQEVMTVKTSRGVIECTPYHKFYIKKPKGTYKYNYDIVEVRAADLNIGDALIDFKLPVIEGNINIKSPYTSGFFSGDGYEPKTGKFDFIHLYQKKRELVDVISQDTDVRNIYDEDHLGIDRTKLTFDKGVLEHKFFVPGGDVILHDRLEWLAGLLDADGYTSGYDIQIVSVNKEFLEETRLMLQTLGCNTIIVSGSNSGYRTLPKNDGSGEYKEYFCQESYRLLIGRVDVQNLTRLGIKFRRLNIKEKAPNRQAVSYTTVEQIIRSGKEEPTYCATEPKRNMIMLNGILTGNCVESFSNFEADELAHTCNLISVNAARCIEDDHDATLAKLATLGSLATILLDCTIGLGNPSIKESQKHNDIYRTIGVGVLGMADYMAYYGKSYETLEGVNFGAEFMEILALSCVNTSCNMAEVTEPFAKFEDSEWAVGNLLGRDWSEFITHCKYPEEWEALKIRVMEKGVRNGQLLAIAPNSSTGIFQGVSPSILPAWKLHYVETTQLGNVSRLPYFVKDRALWYKAYPQVDMAKMIDYIAAMQVFVDSGISFELVLDLNQKEKSGLKYWYSLVDRAWKSGVKTLYYTRFITEDSVKDFDEGCIACKN